MGRESNISLQKCLEFTFIITERVMTERVKIKVQKTFNKSLGKSDKPNVFKNSDGLDDVIAVQQEKEKKIKKYPLRINKYTIIYVSKDNCNEIYAEQYRKKIERIFRVNE